MKNYTSVRDSITERYKEIDSKTSIGEEIGILVFLTVIAIVGTAQYTFTTFVILQLAVMVYSATRIRYAIQRRNEKLSIESQATQEGLTWDSERQNFSYLR